MKTIHQHETYRDKAGTRWYITAVDPNGEWYEARWTPGGQVSTFPTRTAKAWKKCD